MNDTETTTSPEGGFDKNIEIGSRVKTTDMLKVRSGAGTSQSWINNIAPYTGGKVIAGPKYSDGYTWWHIQYDNGTSGWSVENWLQVVSSGAEETNNELVKVNKFNAVVDRENDAHGPYVEFNWNTTGTKNCSLFMGSLAFATNLPSTGSHDDLYRTMLKEKYGKDFTNGNNKFELRCQSAYTEKDSTVSSFVTRSINLNSPEDLEYKLSITKPINYTTFHPGDNVTLRWTQKNLADYQGKVSLVGNNTERHLDGNVDLGEGVTTVTIPVSDKLGTVTPGAYLLKLSVVDVKDGSVQDVWSTAKIDINPVENVAVYKATLNGQVIKSISEVTKSEAETLCTELYNNYEDYNYSYGDVLKCYWDDALFETIDQWKG